MGLPAQLHQSDLKRCPMLMSLYTKPKDLEPKDWSSLTEDVPCILKGGNERCFQSFSGDSPDVPVQYFCVCVFFLKKPEFQNSIPHLHPWHPLLKQSTRNFHPVSSLGSPTFNKPRQPPFPPQFLETSGTPHIPDEPHTNSGAKGFAIPPSPALQRPGTSFSRLGWRPKRAFSQPQWPPMP